MQTQEYKHWLIAIGQQLVAQLENLIPPQLGNEIHTYCIPPDLKYFRKRITQP